MAQHKNADVPWVTLFVSCCMLSFSVCLFFPWTAWIVFPLMILSSFKIIHVYKIWDQESKERVRLHKLKLDDDLAKYRREHKRRMKSYDARLQELK